MHDNHVEPRQSAQRSDCEGTVELVRRLIHDEQLTFVPLVDSMPDNLNEQPCGAAVAHMDRLRLWLRDGGA